MATIKDLAQRYGVAKAQDQNENLGRLAEMLGSARDIGNEYKVPSWVPLAGGTGAGDLLMGRTPEEIENWSYGNAPMQIPEMSNVPQFKRGRAQSLADALTTLAPGVKATEDLPVGMAIKAYHGTPHLFDRFDMSKIGTGEGAQAYGHGLYLAQDPSIAEIYRKNLTANSATLNDKKFDDIVDELDKSAFDYTRTYGSKEKALDALNSKIKDASKFDDVDWLNIVKHRLENSKFEKPQGSIYETSIQWPNAEREAMDPLGEHHLLDWNKPAEGHVQEAIPRKIRELQNARDAISSKYVDDEFNPDNLFSNLYSFPSNEDKAAMDKIAEEIVMHKNMSNAFEKGAEGSVTYNKLIKMLGSPEKASEYLHSIDIPGIKYLDASSRNTDKGTRNFVTFGDEYPQIVKRAGSLDELQEKYATGLATKPIKNLNQALLDKYIERGYLLEDELAKYEKNAAKMRNAGRQDINVQNAQANPEYEAYKAEYDVPFMHGTERLDRVLSKEGLDPKRATSGPMLYGTDSPEIASSYAKNKQDTSMMDDDDWNYSKAFTVAPQQLGHRGTIPYTVEQSWNYLDPEVKRDILTKAPRVGYSDLDQWEGDFVLHPEGEDNAIINQSHYDYLLKQSRGNPIKAMRDYWLDSGNLFNEEEKMSQLYRLAGYPHEISQEMAPWTKREGVLTGVSRIRNPLDTSNVDELREKVIPALKDAFKNDRSRKKDYGADSWDKNTRYTPKEWVNELENDLNKGENSYVWTSIPDKITSELKRLGYNGIYDTGGKSAGADSHQVTIPFNPSQIRSKFAAFDPILKHSPNLLAGTALGSVLLHDEDQGYAEGGIVDKLKSQDFGPNDSVIVSSVMHPSEAAGKAGDWLQEKMRIASGRPYEDNFTPDQQAQAGLDLAGLMQTGAMPFAPASAGGTLGTFIGPKSRNWDKVAAELAAKKLDEGADPAEVWREHLIGRMPDKTLFSEISDKDALYHEHGKDFYDSTLNKTNQLLKHGRDTAEYPLNVQDMLAHPNFYENYPNLEATELRYLPETSTSKGAFGYFADNGDPVLNIHGMLPNNEAKSTMLHELQHGIQRDEGWGQGGSPQEFTRQKEAEHARDVLNWRNEVLARKKKYPDTDTNAIENNIIKDYIDMGLFNDFVPSREARELATQPYIMYPERYDHTNEFEKLNNLVGEYGLDKRTTPYTPIEGYKRLTGEAQARATQDRLDMDMAQRRENYPLAGGKLSDIPLEELIYKYEGNGPSLSADPLSKYKDYVGEHSAPLGDSGAPLHNLTANENAIYPSDVYSSQANQYYGSGEPEDAQLFTMAQRLKDKPNEKVTIYRAVPKMQSNSEKAAQLEKDLANYMKRGRMPSNSDFNNKSDWYEWASNERDRLASLPEETLDPLSINHGDWVALDKKYAKEHGESALGGNYKILSKKVPARQLFTNGDSIREWGWDSRYAEGGSVSMEDLPFDDPDQLRLYHQAMKHYDDVIENTGGSKKMGKTEARINYNTTTKGDRDRDKDLHTLIADYGIDVGKDAKINATMIKPMEAEGVYLGNLTGSVPVGEGRASLGLQGLHTKYSDDLSGYTAGYNGKLGGGDLSASYFEPADHNSAGRQVQLEYSMPFADGGSVSEFEDPTHERLYRRAMAHFDDMSAKQNFEDNDSMIASTILHPVEAAKRAGNAFMRSVDTAGGRPKQALDESSWYPVGIEPSSDEQAQAALDLAGLAQTGAMPFAPESASGVLGSILRPNSQLGTIGSKREKKPITELEEGVKIGKRISTATPTDIAAKKMNYHSTPEHIITLDTMRSNPEAFEKNMKLMSEYMPFNETDTNKQADLYRKYIGDNLRYFVKNAPEDFTQRSGNWYKGANALANDISNAYNIPIEASAGVLARLSPQQNWLHNVEQADRVVDIFTNHQNTVMPVGKYKGVKLKDLPDSLSQAEWIKDFDQHTTRNEYYGITPEGALSDEIIRTKTGEPSTFVWQSFPNLSRAVDILKDPSIENVSKSLGLGGHKIRNFYNNMADPFHPEDVTIDTHAGAAALFTPYSASAIPIGHLFGGGAKKGIVEGSSKSGMAHGMYGLYADSYRDVAKDLNLPAQSLQSQIWELVRETFPTMGKEKMQKQIQTNVLDELKKGKITEEEARNKILDIATKGKGFLLPDWYTQDYAKGGSVGLQELANKYM